MIVKQKDFSYKELSNKYLNIIYNFIEDNTLKGSFFNHFKSSIEDTYIQIHRLIEEIRKNNLDFQIFFQDYKNQILNDQKFYNDGYFMDFFLYYFDEKYPLCAILLKDNDKDEHVIKYEYGWYKYDLGKEYILQSYKSLEDYFNETAECFISSILISSEIRSEFQNSLTNIGNSDVLHIPDMCSVIKKENGFTALIIHLKLFFSLLERYKNSNDINFLELLEKDLKKMNIYYYFENEYLILFFGKNEGKIKIPKKETEKLDMKYNANKYNL